jgi:hypothetical protein
MMRTAIGLVWRRLTAAPAAATGRGIGFAGRTATA